jgi:hypothetical protein
MVGKIGPLVYILFYVKVKMYEIKFVQQVRLIHKTVSSGRNGSRKFLPQVGVLPHHCILSQSRRPWAKSLLPWNLIVSWEYSTICERRGWRYSVPNAYLILCSPETQQTVCCPIWVWNLVSHREQNVPHTLWLSDNKVLKRLIGPKGKEVISKGKVKLSLCFN